VEFIRKDFIKGLRQKAQGKTNISLSYALSLVPYALHDPMCEAACFFWYLEGTPIKGHRDLVS